MEVPILIKSQVSLETEFCLAMEIPILIKYQVSLNNIIQYKQNSYEKKRRIFGFPQSILGRGFYLMAHKIYMKYLWKILFSAK